MLTTDDIRHGYGKTPPGHAVRKNYDKNVDDFDQWLAEHDRQVSQIAWDSGYVVGESQASYLSHVKNPYRKESQ